MNICLERDNTTQLHVCILQSLECSNMDTVQDFESLALNLPKLNTDNRFIICALCYEDSAARVVDIRTVKHVDCKDHETFWCPRYSTTPAPTIFNVCRESREEAHRLASLSGHVLL